MAGKSAILTIKILADASNAQKGVNDTASGIDKFTNGVSKAAVPAAAALAGLGLAAKGAVDSASQLQQAYGGVEAVFGKSADQVKKFADNSADAVGLAKSEYATLATVIGSQLKNAGTPIEELGAKTNDLITTGSDLAATFGGSTSDAVAALSSALKGEMDPIEKYGISLNAAQIAAQRAADGTTDLTGAQDAAAKQTAILELITKQGADAHGQYAAQLNTTAEQQQRANAKFEDAKAALGAALLPVVTEASSKFADMAGWISKNTTVVTIAVGVVALFAGGIIALNVALKAYTLAQEAAKGATAAWTGVQWLLNSAFLASPITWIVVGIVALIASIVLIATKTTWFQDIWHAAWSGIQSAAAAVLGWLQKAGPIALEGLLWPIKQIEKAFDAVVGAISSLVNWLSKIKIPDALSKVGSLIGKINPFMVAPSTPTGPGVSPHAVTSSTTGGGGVTINVNGALDPVAVARQIRAILRADDRRRSGVVIA